jgi:membrane associated rhomboid family serine protease
MGLLDRDYYRDDSGGQFAQWLRQGRVTKILVVAYVALFLIQVATIESRNVDSPDAGPFTKAMGLSAERVLKGEVWRLFTYGFLHTTDNLWHISFHVVLLYFFGKMLEERLGSLRFILFHAAAIVVAGLLFVGATMIGLNGTNRSTTFVGATGAITAMLVLITAQQPNQRVLLFFVLPVPIWVVILLSLGADTWMMLLERPAEDGRRMALAVHLGGIILAGLYFLKLRRPDSFGSPRQRLIGRGQTRLKIHQVEEELEEPAEEPRVPVIASREADEHLEAQLDAVLAKVAQHGKDSLTSSEHAILKRASEIYRKRRK